MSAGVSHLTCPWCEADELMIARPCHEGDVQEPESQFLRWEMYDRDAINIKSMLKVNVVKGIKDSVNSKELMCKGEVNLNDVCVSHPGETVDRWFPMGSDDWSADDGPVRPHTPRPPFLPQFCIVGAHVPRLAVGQTL